jgi:L-lactate utilization protein LutC
MEKAPELSYKVPTGLQSVPTGGKMSEDTKKKISESLKKKNEQKRLLSLPTMHKESVIESVKKEETKKKEEAAKKTKKHAEATKKKISESMKNFHTNKKGRQKEIVNKLKSIIATFEKTIKSAI